MQADRRLYVVMLQVLVLLWLMVPATALADVDLYTARVAVPDQSAGSRDEALPEALAQVLRRVSGKDAEELAGDILQPTRYMQRYEYEQDDDAPQGLWLEVAFDEDALVAALREQGHVIWGRERPTTLVWLAVRDGVDRTVLSRDDDGAVARALADAAQVRGLPVSLPQWDEQDRDTVEFIDLWGGFFETVTAASERYDARTVLAGRVDRDSAGGYRGRWTLLEQDQRRDWETGAGDLRTVIDEGLGELTDLYIARFASGTGDADRDTAHIAVSDVNNLADYARVLEYLEALSVVEAVYVTRVADDELELALVVRGSRERLDGVIGVGSVLRAKERVTVTVGEDSTGFGPDFRYALEH